MNASEETMWELYEQYCNDNHVQEMTDEECEEHYAMFLAEYYNYIEQAA